MSQEPAHKKQKKYHPNYGKPKIPFGHFNKSILDFLDDFLDHFSSHFTKRLTQNQNTHPRATTTTMIIMAASGIRIPGLMGYL
jgi:hypothetical protein